jgi:hypothetical protein
LSGTTAWLLEHGAFFLGCLSATIGAGWDLREDIRYQRNKSTHDDDDDDDNTAGVGMLTFWSFSKFMATASTLFYLVNVASHILLSRRGGQLSISVTFGVAASFDLLSCLLEDDYEPWPSYYLGAIAVHVYLMSAVLTIYRSRHYYSRTSPFLFMVGDFLFLIGSLIDVGIGDYDAPTTTTTANDASSADRWVALSAWSLVSALLWSTTAVINLVPDQKRSVSQQQQLAEEAHHELIVDYIDNDGRIVTREVEQGQSIVVAQEESSPIELQA